MSSPESDRVSPETGGCSTLGGGSTAWLLPLQHDPRSHRGRRERGESGADRPAWELQGGCGGLDLLQSGGSGSGWGSGGLDVGSRREEQQDLLLSRRHDAAGGSELR